MQRHGRIEIGFPRAHLHGDRQQLRHLSRVVTENMHAQHAIGLAIDDDLHEGLLVAPGQRRLHRPEFRGIDIDHREDLARFFFGHTDCADLRRREDRRRHMRVIHGDILAAEHMVGEEMPLADRDRREIQPVRDVADGIDRRRAGLRMRIDENRALVVDLHARRFKTEMFRQRRAAGRQQHDIGLDRRAIRHVYAQTAGRLFDR